MLANVPSQFTTEMLFIYLSFAGQGRVGGHIAQQHMGYSQIFKKAPHNGYSMMNKTLHVIIFINSICTFFCVFLNQASQWAI